MTRSMSRKGAKLKESPPTPGHFLSITVTLLDSTFSFADGPNPKRFS